MTWSESGGWQRGLHMASVARLPQLVLHTLNRQRGDHAFKVDVNQGLDIGFVILA